MRCGLLKQYRQLSYEELAFHLENSTSFRAFARLPLSWTPQKSTLHKTISAIRAETWEAINRILLVSARQEKLEDGKVVRLDSTVTAALLHEPTDSSLLWDRVRVMVRLLKQADALIGGLGGATIGAPRRNGRARSNLPASADPAQLYRELIKMTRATLADPNGRRCDWPWADPCRRALACRVRRYRPLIERIIAQTERRVLHGEPVPPTRRSSACSSRTPPSSSKAAARFNTATSST